jgi:DNA repair protein RadC
MSKEQAKPGMEPGVLKQSLRDYWTRPASRNELPSTTHPAKRNTSRPQNDSPSLWDMPLSQPQPDNHGQQEYQERNQEASPSALEGAIVSEPSATSSPLHPADRSVKIFERLSQRGIASLSDAEVLSVALRTDMEEAGSSEGIHALLANYTIQQLMQVDLEELSDQLRSGSAKAAQLQAILEVSRRLLLPPPVEKYQIRTAADAARLVMPEMAFLDHEEMRVLLLDTKNIVIANLLSYQGTINTSVLRAAEIYKPAIARNSPHIIVCHNHPSGDPVPSPEDLAVTQQLVKAGELLDIELLDHLIIGQHPRFTSIREVLRW